MDNDCAPVMGAAKRARGSRSLSAAIYCVSHYHRICLPGAFSCGPFFGARKVTRRALAGQDVACLPNTTICTVTARPQIRGRCSHAGHTVGRRSSFGMGDLRSVVCPGATSAHWNNGGRCRLLSPRVIIQSEASREGIAVAWHIAMAMTASMKDLLQAHVCWIRAVSPFDDVYW